MKHQQLKNNLREAHIFVNRTVFSTVLVIILIVLIISRLVWLQVYQHDKFTTKSIENRVKLIPQPPTRGLIYDRNGKLLAQNLPSFSLEITPEKTKDLDKTIDQLQQFIDIGEEDLKRFRKLKRNKRRFDSIPIKVRLTEEEVARFSVNQHRFPSVQIAARLLRNYPYADLTAHILGYVGRISTKDLNIIDPAEYAGTSHIGKVGLEKSYEKTLHGKVGFQQVEVNARGRVIRILEEQLPASGKDLHLYLDIDLQQVAWDAFGERRGAAIAIDPQTGGVLAMVSKPGFDPNLFVEGISSKKYIALNSSIDKPLFDRALRGQYPPGSTVKQFIGLVGLETGAITHEETIFCPGYYQLPGHSHKYRDWKKWGHGKMSINHAITQSCDVFYYELAHRMGIKSLHQQLTPFGFGKKTGIDLPSERPGLLPSPEWKRKKYNQPWYPGETLIMGIGQGYFLSTPLQLAVSTATLAADGLFTQPRMVATLHEKSSDVYEPTQVVQRHVPKINEANWNDIKFAMSNVINSPRGTAKRIKSEHYTIAGKTGTAQVFTVPQDETYDETKISDRMKDHALFVAFAPIDNPKIAISIIVENGGHGGSDAAPVAKAMMDYYLKDKP